MPIAGNIDRSVLLQGAAGLAVTAAGLGARSANATTTNGGTAMDTDYRPAGKGIVTGRGRGDFDFLAGAWLIRHRKRKAAGKDEWSEFASSAEVHRVLDGLGSIEELRNPDASFLGMGVRVWLTQEQKWADHWTSAANGVVNPPQLGQFIDGEGVFTSEETVDGVKWIYRGVWDKITPASCRWHQSSSADGGKSWEWDWWMEWTRRSER